MRFSVKRLVHLVVIVVVIQMVIYFWSMKSSSRHIPHQPINMMRVQSNNISHGTCSYQLCPKIKDNVLNIHLIPHSHVDIGWTHTVDEFYTGAAVATSCTKCILELTIKELAKNPDRRYIFIEMKYFSRFWSEINENDRDLIRQLIRERRLELVGGGWVMSDAGVTMYNDIIDQHTLGFDFIADTFGPCAQARGAWHVDLFGYSREHASIMSQMGYESLTIGRIDFQDMDKRKRTKNMEFLWYTSPDNFKARSVLFTNILYDGYYAPEGYRMDHVFTAPKVTDDMANKYVNLIKEWAKSYKTNNIAIPVGSDFAFRNAKAWFDFYDELIKKSNELNKDVNLLYTTPTCYTYHVNKEVTGLNDKTDDFQPYSIAPAAYWSGFFTSRGGLKRHIRLAGQILQSCKQLAIFTDVNNTFHLVNNLRDAMGIVQHHDAITGTQRKHVLKDYNKILSVAKDDCQTVMSMALNKMWDFLTARSVSPKFCYDLNVSACAVTEQNNQFLVTFYNPLSWSFDVDIRFPVRYGQAVITDGQGYDVQYQIVTVHEHITRIQERNSKEDKELVIMSRLPPMSATTFSVQQQKGEQTTSKFEKPSNDKDLILENKYLSLTFSNETGLLQTVRNKESDITEQVHHEFRYYEAEQDSNRPSGVYLFTPKSHVTYPVAKSKVKLTIIRGDLVQEVHQTFSPWVSQIIRLYKGSKHVELQWTVGPIDDSDNQGKEVISIFTTSVANDDIFYTDSNGREMLKRTKDEKDTMRFQPKNNVSGNYYPITSRIYIKDLKRNVQLTVLTDRAQGGSSLKPGTVELMVHRRVRRDDDLGLAEDLMDDGIDGKGIVYTGKHYIVLDSPENSALLVKRLALQIHLAPSVMFTPLTNEYQLKQAPAQLPENVHILTLDRIKAKEGDLLLLRLEHLFEENESSQLSTPVEVSLEKLFTTLDILSAVELTLGGNFSPADLKRLQWNTFSDKTPDNIRSPYYKEIMEPPFTVSLRPMEIRTFNILVSRQS